jgi:ATP-binding cassette subfamily B protein RaxB
MSGAVHRLNFGWRRRPQIVLHSEPTESGLACLLMIAEFYGHDSDLPSLRRRYLLSSEVAVISRLVEVADWIGLRSRPIKIDSTNLSSVPTPCILRWDCDHYVVLETALKSQLRLLDPRVGECTVSVADAIDHLDGSALHLTPRTQFEAHSKNRRTTISFRALMGRLEGIWGALAQIVSLALMLEFFSLLIPLFVQVVTDQVLANGDADLLLVMGIGFLVVVLLQAGISALRSWRVICLGATVNFAWITNVFSHLLKLPDQYFQQRHVGEVVSRVDSVNVIQQTLTARFVEGILEGLMAILILGVLILYSQRLALITLFALGLYVVIRVSAFSSLKTASSMQILALAEQQSVFLESLRGVRAIRLHNQGGTYSARFANAVNKSVNRNVVVQRTKLIFRSAQTLVFGAHRVAILWSGALLALHGKITVGMLLAFVVYSDQFTTRVSTLVDYLTDLRLLRLHGDRVADIVLHQPERYVESDYSGSPNDRSVEFRDVGFRYTESGTWVLRNFNMVIAEGESVALVGPSGTGKSTIAKLVVGLLDPQEGSILIGGVDIKRLGKSRVRRLVGVVMQDDNLFAGSFADNITLFASDPSDADIENAARAAAIHDEIVANPLGYQTLVGDMGAALSGGQRQRMILARELYRQPQILVLDEATSHLDSENERKVSEAIRHMNLTRIILAHRSETIATADRVINVRKQDAPAMSHVLLSS